MMSEWKALLQVREKIDPKNKVHQREHGCLLVELRLPAFIFCMWEKFMKVVHDKKPNNVKEI